jgi:hypothetical protein
VLKGVAMERREFLKMGTAAGLVSSAKMLEPLAQAEQAGSGAKRIPKRKLGKTGEELSIIGFAGIVVMENSPSFASNTIEVMFMPPVLKITQGVLNRCENLLLYMILQGVSRKPFCPVLIPVGSF